MASVKFVAVSRGLSGILDYVTNREKTTDALITGVNCVAQMARDEFEAVKKQFHKTDGRGYYHIVQSFSPDDPLDFKTAHEIGIKFAEYFQGYQCVVATHMNTDHKILRERGVLNPQAYFNQNNPDYYKNSDYWRKPYDWHATSIRVILNNPVYLGKVVYGRSKQKGFFDKRGEEVPEDEWIVTENAHEPLISQELWDTVHQMMKARRRENGSHEVQPFAGLVKCASCGSSLNVSYDKKRRRYTGFSCWVYKNYGKERCTSHAIGWKALNQLVLEDIRRNAQAAKLASEDYKNMLISMRMEKKAKEIGRCKRELKKADKRVAELEKILTKLYEDAALGKISEERYQSMAAAYEREQGVLKDQREALSAEIAQGEEVYQNVEYFLPLIQKYTDITELNAHILNELIEKIVVHEKQIDEDGIKSQQVDIYYKFIEYINMKELLINGGWCVQDTPEGQKLTLVKLA